MGTSAGGVNRTALAAWSWRLPLASLRTCVNAFTTSGWQLVYIGADSVIACVDAPDPRANQEGIATMTLKHGHDHDAHEDHRWSQQVTESSDALDLSPGLFEQDDPRAIARSLKRSAESSTRRKAPPFRSAMSMLVFYINRAGKNLPQRQREILEQAKDELRDLYGKPRKNS